MPKLYVTRYCVRCGKELRVCIPTFVCDTCPVKITDVSPENRGTFYDYIWGTKIQTKQKPVKKKLL
jgi:hypothetical protein